MKITRSDVVVIGGGIMGSSAAFFLARRGKSVTLLERDLVGQHASGTNFGNTRRQGRPLFQLPLANRASAIWKQSKALLGADVEYLQGGHMRVTYAGRDEDEARMAEYARDARELGLELEMITGDSLRQRFPFLGPEVGAGSYCHEDGHANPRLVAPAFARAAAREGATVRENARIIAVEKVAGDFHVLSEHNELYRAPVLVIATGAWGGELAAQFHEPVPITSRGPTMSVTEPAPYAISPSVGVSTKLAHEAVYFRQIPRGNVIIGGSIRGPGFPNTCRTHVRPANSLSQFREIQRLAPGVGKLRVIRVWSGTEGYFDDERPVLGPSAKIPDLYYAFGFSGNGFQLGPGVGETLAELIATGRTDIDLSHYRVNRFYAV